MTTVREEITLKIAELEAELAKGGNWLETEAHSVRAWIHGLFSKPVYTDEPPMAATVDAPAVAPAPPPAEQVAEPTTLPPAS